MKMVGVRFFRPPCNSYSALAVIPHNLITFSPLNPSKTHKFNSSLSLHSNASPKNVLLQGRTGVAVFASKKRRKSVGNLLEKDDFDDGDDNEDEDEDGVLIPFESMRQWVQNKPPGFGEGKEFDTSIEDKLLEEMEQSRRAQLANINNLKNNPLKPSSKEQKVPEVVPNGIRVCVGNLPKKKNIHRDLQLVFKGFPGIVNISPAVSGNKKTRDPICKGFAFVYLGSKEAANRFIQMYSCQSITFGKIQKQITCEIREPGHSSDQSAEVAYTFTPELSHPGMVEDPDTDSDEEDISLDSSEVSSSDKSTFIDDLPISAKREEIEEGIEKFNLLEPNNKKNMGSTMADKTDLSSKQQQKRRTVQKKLVVKGKKPKKAHKLSIPGSAKRLKIKEKAILTDVFSKYGAKASVASIKES